LLFGGAASKIRGVAYWLTIYGRNFYNVKIATKEYCCSCLESLTKEKQKKLT